MLRERFVNLPAPMRLRHIASILAIGLLTACASVTNQAATGSDNLTVGTVQREIRVGMTGGEFISVLGSPNIVTTDENRQEVWVYDKISTVRAYKKNSAYATLVLLGAKGSSGAEATSQKTLTVVIKFDKESRVRDFAYHTTRF